MYVHILCACMSVCMSLLLLWMYLCLSWGMHGTYCISLHYLCINANIYLCAFEMYIIWVSFWSRVFVSIMSIEYLHPIRRTPPTLNIMIPILIINNTITQVTIEIVPLGEGSDVAGAVAEASSICGVSSAPMATIALFIFRLDPAAPRLQLLLQFKAGLVLNMCVILVR